MRRLLTFSCGDATLAASLDDADGTIGVLMVTGGSQTRIGSHRMYEQLAKSLAARGFPCFRYDRRGVGDSSGDDPGYRHSSPDVLAAADAFRAAQPTLQRIIGFGLCDGAAALALHGAHAGIDAVILVNPWLVEAEAGEMAPAAVRAHYREKLFSPAAWKHLLSGGVNLSKLAGGLKQAASATDGDLAAEVAAGLRKLPKPSALILANGDGTAIAARAQVDDGSFAGLIRWRRDLATDSHTFARPGDPALLDQAVADALKALA